MGELGSGNGSSYPATLDTAGTEIDSPNAGKTKARADVPNDLYAAIVAIEKELGIDPAGTLADVKTFLQTEHNADGTHQGALVQTSVNVGGGAVAGDSVVTNLAAGTYTPTLTNGTNVAASTAYLCRYLRVNNVVTVSGRVDIDTTSASTATVLYMSLPITTNFTGGTISECTGTANPIANTVSNAGIIGLKSESANNEANFNYTSGLSTASLSYSFILNYQII